MRLTLTRPSPPLRLLWERVGLGFAQGVALYGLHSAFEAKVGLAAHPLLFAPTLMVAAMVPLLVLSGLGELRWRTLAVWTVVAATVVAYLAYYDLARDPGDGKRLTADFGATLACAAWLFIAHHLIVPADAERKWLAPYQAYFDTAWKHGVQLVLSAGFTGVFWALLYLGAALFKLIKIDGPSRLIEHDWFALPATATALALAVHLTDVRASLVRGVRTVALTLLSWLLPVMALIAVAFLAALPFTGLDVLWRTRSAAGLLLSAAAALVFLTNATYQDGSRDAGAPRSLQWAGRAAALALIPLVAISAYALGLRIAQHGLTPERIIAAACTLVAACYALGYGAAAVRRGPWLKLLERTNIVTALVILAVLLVLFTPIADPARISVEDQVHRLETGRIAPDKFDYAFLRFDGARYGKEALERLKTRTQGPGAGEIRSRAADALHLEERPPSTPPVTPGANLASIVTTYPKGSVFPDDFRVTSQNCTRLEDRCKAFLLDLNGDNVPELLLQSGWNIEVFQHRPEGGWDKVGDLVSPYGCDGDVRSKALEEGRYSTVSPIWNDLMIDGSRYQLNSNESCKH